MSDAEEKDTNYEEITSVSQDEANNKSEINSEGNVPRLETIKNIENIDALSENIHLSTAKEGSGDAIGRILQENTTKSVKELTELSKEFLNTNSGKDCGDYTAKTKASDGENKKVEDTLIDLDLKEANPSKSDVDAENDDKNKIDHKQADDLDDIEDDDMELRWDDDDSSNQAPDDNTGITDSKNVGIQSEDQILEETSDVISKETSKVHSNENSKVFLDSDMLKDNNEKRTGDNKIIEMDTTKESKISTKLNIPEEMDEEKNMSKDELLQETHLNSDEEMDIPATENVDGHDYNAIEEKLLDEFITHTKMQVIARANEILQEKHMDEVLNESELSREMQVITPSNGVIEEKNVDEPLDGSEIDSALEVIAQVNEFLEEKSMVEPTKETESENDITTDKHSKEIPQIDIENEPESKPEMQAATFKMPSFTDVILDQRNDDVMSQENLLEEHNSKVKDDDILLEEKLLEETETAEIILETDETMELDDYNEVELLKDDESEDDSCPMDVDNINQSDDCNNTTKIVIDSNQVSNLKGSKINEMLPNNSSMFLDDSLVPIKTDHGLHKPDVMLEIPTQELIDMDDTDLSMNFGQSDVIDSLNDIDDYVDEDIEHEETVDKKIITKDDSLGPKAITKIITEVDTVNKKSVTEANDSANETPVTETTDCKMFTDGTLSKTETVNKKSATIPNDDLVVPSQTPDIGKTIDKIATNDVDDMVNKKCVSKTTVDEIVSDDDIINKESLSEAVDDAVNTDTKKTVDKIVTSGGTANKISVTESDNEVGRPKETLETEITVHKTVTDDTVNIRSVTDAEDPKAVSKTTVDKIASKDYAVKEKSADQEAIVNQQTVTKAKKDSDIVEDTVQSTIEESMEKILADNELDEKKEVAQCIGASYASQKMRRYREKLKKDPVRYEEYKKKDLLRVKLRYKKNKELSEIKKANRRKKWREEREKQKEKNNDREENKTECNPSFRIDATESSRIMRRYREKLNSDPVSYDEHRREDLNRVKIRNKKIEELSENENANQRGKWMEQKERQKEKNTEREENKTTCNYSFSIEIKSEAVLSEQPSTSITHMTPDSSDEVPEISDSLGLLAESAGRMMEDDEEPEDDDDGDDDDDFDHDESSNQISAEQSEDSNPAALDTEPVTDLGDKDLETPEHKDDEFSFTCDSTSQDKAEKMDVEEFGTVEFQAETVTEMNTEAQSAVDALLKDNADDSDQNKDQKSTTSQMDIETVKLSDTSDNEVDAVPTKAGQTATEPGKVDEGKTSPKQSSSQSSQSPRKESPSKMKNLAITTQAANAVVNIVDLEESSSSEDDIQEVQKQPDEDTTQDDKPPSPESDVTNVNIPTGIEIMCSGESTSEITTKEGEVVISGVPKPPPHKLARLNTSEVSIKTVSTTEPMVIPETRINDQTTASTQSKPKLSLEIFSLDSDDEDSAAKAISPSSPEHKMTAQEVEKARETSKCINYCCTSDGTVTYKMADEAVIAYYDSGRKRRSMVCLPCADVVANRTKNLIEGIKDLTPLLKLEMGKMSEDLVQISDSESEDEDVVTQEEPKEPIGEKGAKFIEENLAQYLNDAWKKYDMDIRLKETQIMLEEEMEKLEQDRKEIDAMLSDCQKATDKLRCELYATFECRRQQLPALIVFDTPESKYSGLEEQLNPPAAVAETIETRQAKRRLSSTSESTAKRPAIPLGYAPLDSKDKAVVPAPDAKFEDDRDISVVKLSAEAAPADLPPPGEISRPPLRVGMPVYAMKNAFGPWLKGRVLEMQPKNPSAGNPFSQCRVKFDHKTKTNGKVLNARCIAYSEPADVRMTIGTRLIALFKDMNKRESYYSGVVAEIPNPVNNYRYLVFFDDGYAQYVQHQFTRLVCESSPLVWEEVHPFSREFVREYLLAYPERPMVRLHEGQKLKTEWNGKWWSSRVLRVDASLAQVLFVGDGRREWIYRGSTRLAPLYLELRAAERHRPRPMPRSKAQPRFNMPYVEYTRSDEQEPSKQADPQVQQQQQIRNEEIRRQRAVAKKSVSTTQVLPPAQDVVTPTTLDPVTSRVVYYTPKNAVKPLKMAPHKCSPKCKRSDVLSLKELRTYNPLAKPLLSGWERQIVRFKGHKEVMYRAPCGRRLRNMRELHHYLRSIDSDLPVDLFDFHYSTHCLAEFVLNKCLVGKKDLSHGKENVPVPCVNYYDDSLPEFCSYNTERTPTAGVPLNLEPEFLCGCDCTDDCQDKSKCACWKMTLEGARTIGLRGPNVGYVYRRLPEPLPSGIYECNSRCKCKHTCLNRVAQQPLQLKLQVFKTPNRGWGIRALNDVPKGSFLCVYAGNLLTDATANLDGLNEGDEYLAELDYIEVVEQMKEGYEEDIPDADKKLDKIKGEAESDDEEPSSSEEEDTASKTDKEDDDFRPGYIGLGVTEFSKRLRKREKAKKEKENPVADEKEKEKETPTTKETNAEEDCITISDDEEVREPSRFMAQTNMGANEYISKYKSVRTLFGRDEACYIMDAKVQGNIGRYLNHSCCPNVFVQNVFVDTHDPRFPWVAFFALSHIKAGTELTWNYNYDVGSVPGKVLYCYCGAVNCRGRLL